MRIILLEEMITEMSGISPERLRGKCRKKEYNEARQLIWYVAHDYMMFSYADIGKMYNRDGSTVRESIKWLRELSKKNEPSIVTEFLDRIRERRPELLEKVIFKTVENWDAL